MKFESTQLIIILIGITIEHLFLLNSQSEIIFGKRSLKNALAIEALRLPARSASGRSVQAMLELFPMLNRGSDCRKRGHAPDSYRDEETPKLLFN